MESKNVTMLDLLVEAHIGLDRQGPGSREMIEQALEFIKPFDKFSQIADLGCGTGGQTMVLGQHLSGTVTGVDMFPAFIDVFNKRAKELNFADRVKGVVGTMENLPFKENSLDLIWSEGAIDNIGFKNGISYWRNYLKKNGFVVVSCPSWLTKEHSKEAENFWLDAGSQLDCIGKNIEIMQECGYQFIASFTLPSSCWKENYFIPREVAINGLIKKYAENEVVLDYAKQNKHETELYDKYNQYYGYVFYIGKAI